MAESNYSRKMLEQVSERLGELYATVEQGIKADNAVPKTTQINGKSLSGDITLTPTDVGARPNTWLPTPDQIGAQPVPSNAVVNNFSMFNSSKLLVDSGKNANSFLPNIYDSSDANHILTVNTSGAVQASESVPANIAEYSVGKSYVLNEAFYYGNNEERGIYITTVAHGSEAFNTAHNALIARVGVDTNYVKFNLSSPSANQVYITSGTLQQQIQGLLNNIKDLRDRVAELEGTAVISDTPRVKLNISTTPTEVQPGYKVVRIDPNDVL